MKKIFAFIMVLTLALAVLTACGEEQKDEEQKEEKATIDLDSLKTMGDAFALEAENDQFGSDDQHFVYVFEIGGTAYRVIADMTKEVQKEMDKLDASKEDFNDKTKEAAASLEISKRENLTEMIPPQEELDNFAGKTGQELLDDGWTVSGWDIEENTFTMNKGPFAYTVVIDSKLKESDDFDGDEEIKKLKIKTIKYSDIGDATNLDDESQDK